MGHPNLQVREGSNKIMNVRILGGTTNCDVIIRNVNVEKKKEM